MKIAIYPGSFDPVTYGHLDIIKRSNKLFNVLIIAIAQHTLKSSCFDIKTRLNFIRENINNLKLKNIKVLTYTGLTVDFARQHNAKFIVRGIRDYADFEYEFKMAQVNKKFNKTIETVFLLTNFNFVHISSRLIKNIAKISINNIKNFVPKNVFQALLILYNKK